jgi:UDP-glucuronate 4-epimerase
MPDNVVPGSPKIAGLMQPSTILVTGAAGFIGAHVAARLRMLGHTVVGCDNFNDYYAPALKTARVQALLGPLGVPCERVELADPSAVRSLFDTSRPRIVVHLAAQAGVRYSLTHPQPYIQSNLVGFANMLESARHGSVDHIVYASSSSVYGECHEMPFRESQPTDSPVSLYAATKKANELMAHAYSHIYGLRATGLRFFTVYGPWGRPDMAYFSFAEKILAGEALPVFADGKLQRDFTYIDDIVEGVVRLTLSARPDGAPAHEVFNIGNHTPVTVLEFIKTLSELMGRQPELQFLPMQPGDVPVTCADIDKLHSRVGFQPSTSLRDGLARFVEWFDAWKARTT